MGAAWLLSFFEQLYPRDGQPFDAQPRMRDMMHIVHVYNDRFVVNRNRDISLTDRFAYSEGEWALWREQPWVEPERSLSEDEIAAVVVVITFHLHAAQDRVLDTHMLCFHIRYAFMFSQQHLSDEEFRRIIQTNPDRFHEDEYGNVQIADANYYSAAEWAHWVENRRIGREEPQSEEGALFCSAS